MKVYELTFGKGDSVDAVSLVEMPAIEEEAVFLKTDTTRIKLSLDTEKREIIGAALVPNKPIFRKGNPEDYYIYFSKDTVQSAMNDFMQPIKKNSFTLEHESSTSEVVAMESWIVKGEEDKANTLYNLDAPEGSWILRTHVPNKKYWNSVIKAGNFNGYSIEAKLGNKIARQELSDNVLDYLVDGIKEVLTNYYNN